MYNSENIRNNVNYIINLISKINADVLLDFNSKKEMHYFLEYTNDNTIFELSKIEKTIEEVPAKIILVTESGQIQKLSLLANKKSKINHYEVSFSMILPMILPMISPMIFKFLWIFFESSQLYFDFIFCFRYVESFVQTYFDNTKSKKPVFLLSNGHNIDRIKKDIEYFKNSAVLTSRLAIFIYKICRWNFNISGTKVGTFFAYHYNKSKNYNNKEYDIKNVKGYHVSAMNMHIIMEERIRIIMEERIRIARYLLENNANCDLNIIAQATQIPNWTLEEIARNVVMQSR